MPSPLHSQSGYGTAGRKIPAPSFGDKDRVTIEDTFAKLVDLVTGLDAEGRRAAEEGLSEDEYALFCLLGNLRRQLCRDADKSESPG